MINEIKQLLSTPKKIVITTHKSPDGDAMGSSLGLMLFLEKLNHQAIVIIPNAFPGFLAWMPGAEKTVVFETQEKQAVKALEEADIIFSLDYNHLSRIDQVGPPVAKSSAIKIMIDHHQQPDTYPTYTFSDTSKSSTCEMVFDFITDLGYDQLIDAVIGQCIYTGIMTDTASFRFDSATSATFKKAASLIDKGLAHARVHEAVYDTNTYDRLQLMGFTLSERFKLLPEIGVAYLWLTESDLAKYNYQPGDTEGFVNYGLSIKGIRLSAFFTEREGKIKISFRSKGLVDVNTFSRLHFNGGGHKNAAGGATDDHIEQTIQRFLELIPDYLKQYA